MVVVNVNSGNIDSLTLVSGNTYELTGNVTITNVNGFGGTSLTGVVFDGKGYTITVNVFDFKGLFGSGASSNLSNPGITVRNLEVAAGIYQGTGLTSTLATGGGWFFRAGNSSVTIYGRIENCKSTGQISPTSGGFFGQYTCGAIIDSYSTGNINSEGGGIFGAYAQPGSNINYCYTSGNIGVINGGEAGGLIGKSGNGVSITNSYVSGYIFGPSGYVAGLNSSNLTITNFYGTSLKFIHSGGIGLNLTNSTQTNVLTETGWSDTNANSTLSGSPDEQVRSWYSNAPNTPYVFLRDYVPQLATFTIGGTDVLSTNSIMLPYSTTTSVSATAVSGTVSYSPSLPWNLLVGSNTVSATVTDAGKIQTYTRTVTVESTDATITVNGTTYSGQITVASNVSSVNIAVAPVSSSVTVSGAGTKSLTTGLNTFTITVNGQSGSSQTYTVNVYRQSNNTTVTITVDGEVVTDQQIVYVPYGTSRVAVGVTTADPNALYETIGGNMLFTTDNQIGVYVTAEDRNITSSYGFTVTILPMGSDTLLSTFTIDGQAVQNGDTVTTNSSSVTVVATPITSKSTVVVSGASGLDVGNNTVSVLVTAQNGSTVTYSVTVVIANILANPTISLSDFTVANVGKLYTKLYTFSGITSTLTVSSPDIVQVTDNKVKVIGAGTCVVSTVVNGITSTYTINSGKFTLYPVSSLAMPEILTANFNASISFGQNLTSLQQYILTFTLPIALTLSPITYTSSNTSVATVSSTGFVTIVSTGSTDITASYAGDSLFEAVSYSSSYNIRIKDSQTITFADIPNKVAGGSVTLDATASSGLNVSYDITSVPDQGVFTMGQDNIIQLTGAGSVTVTAKQLGNMLYSAATNVVRTFTVSYGPITITKQPLSLYVEQPPYQLDYSFSVEVTPTTNVSYQWYLKRPDNTDLLLRDSPYFNGTARTSTFTTKLDTNQSAATWNHSEYFWVPPGRYFCRITNGTYTVDTNIVTFAKSIDGGVSEFNSGSLSNVPASIVLSGIENKASVQPVAANSATMTITDTDRPQSVVFTNLRSDVAKVGIAVPAAVVTNNIASVRLEINMFDSAGNTLSDFNANPVTLTLAMPSSFVGNTITVYTKDSANNTIDTNTFTKVINSTNNEYTGQLKHFSPQEFVDNPTIPPVITENLVISNNRQLNMTYGASLPLNIIIANTTNISYKWYVNSVEVPNTNAETFEFVPTSPGSYPIYVIATNTVSNLSVQSYTANVVVGPRQFILYGIVPADGRVKLGLNKTITASAIGNGTLSYQWKKNGVNVGSSSTSNTYTITNAQLSDEGEYTVVVTDSYNDDTRNSTTNATIYAINQAIAVHAPIVVTKQPLGVYAANGSSISLSCEASGNYMLHTWGLKRTNGTNIFVQRTLYDNSPILTGTLNTSLSADTWNGMGNDLPAGSYFCRIDNFNGMVDTNNATVGVSTDGGVSEFNSGTLPEVPTAIVLNGVQQIAVVKPVTTNAATITVDSTSTTRPQSVEFTGLRNDVVKVAIAVPEVITANSVASVRLEINLFDSTGNKLSDFSANPVTLTIAMPSSFVGNTITVYTKDSANNTIDTNIFTKVSNSTTNEYTGQLKHFSPQEFVDNKDTSVPCFVKGTKIQTATGPKNVEDLNSASDRIVTHDGRSVAFKLYSTHVAKATKETAPYVIKAGAFGQRSPAADISLSPLHAIQAAKGVWQIPKYAALSNTSVRQYGVGESVTYYHVELPNYFTDNIVAEGGVVVESYGAKQCAGMKNVFKYNATLGGFTRAMKGAATVKR